jgi:transcriptional regulator with PAS, ATPase and Fis domain
MNQAVGSSWTEGQPMIGESPSLGNIKAYLRKVASTDSNVLITGETGTGKEVTAELIHRHSGRRQKPLVCLNCAALPDSLLESELFGYQRGAFTGAEASNPGKLQQAEGGTVFFDEVGDMSPYAQAKVLRLLESKQVQRLGASQSVCLDIRVIAATNQDLEAAMAQGKFRQDLYFRLNVARIHLPPLRERRGDIPLLLQHYLREFNRRLGRRVEGFSEGALQQLLSYEWPGNIRELKNLLEATFVNLEADGPRARSQRICLEDLPEPFRSRFTDRPADGGGERDRLLTALLSTQWNKSQAAQKLHWSRMTLYRKLAKYDLLTRPETTEEGVTLVSGGPF